MDYLPELGTLVLLLHGLAVISSAQEPYTFYFDGTSRLSYELPADEHSKLLPVNISFRFWAEREEGVLFFSYADPGDTITMELFEKTIFHRIRYHTATNTGVKASGLGLGLSEGMEWRDVEISADAQGFNFSMGKVSSSSPKPKALSLGKQVYIGGYSMEDEDIKSKRNYRGCMQDFTVNGVNIFKAFRQGDNSVSSLTSFPSTCPLITSYMTFRGLNSYIKIQTSDVSAEKSDVVADIVFEFSTYDYTGTLLLLDLGATNISVEFQANSTVLFRTLSGGFGFNDDFQLGFDVGDAKYHRLEVKINSTGLGVFLDDFYKFDTAMGLPRNSQIQSYYIGGIPGDIGYKGCIRELRINGARFEVRNLAEDQVQDAVLGECSMLDRCYSPDSRCSHGGRCIRSRDNFECDCTGTGYDGPNCHTPMYPSGCESVSFPPNTDQVTAQIDVDGPGPQRPVQVICKKDPQGIMWTQITSSKLAPTRVDGFQDPGSYSANVTYGMSLADVTGVLNRAETCKQFIKYTCTNSKLMSVAEGSNVPYGWWVDRRSTPQYYWGGAEPGSRACGCSAQGVCLGGLSCNCDAGENFATFDEGFLTNKTTLPVTKVRFGDTGTLQDSKSAEYVVGNVECSGDALLKKAVTITKLGAFLPIRSRWLSNNVPMDIAFQFKTTIGRAQLLYSDTRRTRGHYLSIVLEDPYHISLKMKFSDGDVAHTETLPYQLNDNEWHSVYFELTFKRSMLKIDSRPESILWESNQWRFYTYLTIGKPLMLGGNMDGTVGFVGCFRGLVLDGKNIDLQEAVENDNRTDIVKGCQGRCDSMSQCQNGGKCTEYYATYMCDCAPSAFSGCYCGNAIGVRLPQGSWMLFMVQDRLPSPLQYVQIHFKSTQKQGVLAHLADTAGAEIVTAEINLRGGVDITYNSGSGRTGLFTSRDGLTDGAAHRVTIRVTQSADGTKSTWDVEFDDEVQTKEGAALTQTPQRFYLGSKSSVFGSGGFDGCIFGVMFNSVPVLKEAKTTPTPAWVSYDKSVNLDENDCGETENNHATAVSNPTKSVSIRQPALITRFGSQSMDTAGPAIPSLFFMDLTCSSKGSPTPSFMIEQNDAGLMCPHLLVEPNRILLPADDRVHGQYRCLAENEWGKSMSQFVQVQAPKLMDVLSVLEDTMFMREGQYLRLRCNVSVESFPEASTEWDGVDIMDNTGDHVYQGEDGDLHFLSVKQTDSKVFTCYKVNSQLAKRVEVKRVRLQVNPVSNVVPKEDEIVYSSPTQMMVDIGKTAVLECVASGSPSPNVTWLVNGNSVENTSAVPQLRGRRLVVSNFSLADEGEYTCTIEGDTVSSTIMLNATQKPSWLRGPSPTAVYQGDQAKLYCVSRPSSELVDSDTEWYINGELLHLKPSYSLNQAGDVLTIEKASKSTDIFTFQCNVSNQYGFVYGEGYLDVLEKTTFVDRPTDQTITRNRGWADFSVTISSDMGANVTIAWYYGDNQTPITNSFIYNVNTEKSKSRLRVDLSSLTSEAESANYGGDYRCVITDGVRSQTASAKLIIQLPDNTGSGNGDPTGGASKNGNLLGILVPFILLIITAATDRRLDQGRYQT